MASFLAYALTNNYVFSDIVLDLKSHKLDNNMPIHIKKAIDEMITSTTNDIEDFYDLIMLINSITYAAIEDKNMNDEFVGKLITLRVYAKKQVKYKFRALKDDKEKDLHEATRQYFDGVKYVWKPSLTKLAELVKIYRPSITLI